MTAETCALCHAPGQIAQETTLHDAVTSTALAKGSISVLSADFTPVGTAVKPVITFQVKDRNGANVPNWGAFNFTIAKLEPATSSVVEHWQSFLNAAPTTSFNAIAPTREAGGASTSSTPKGTLSYDSGTQTYTYTFATDIANVTSPLAVPYSATDTIRIGMQITTYNSPSGVVTPAFDYANGIADFVPANGTAPNAALAREIVTTAACNACHGRLTVHGRRIEVNYCVTCHNQPLVDANGRSGDMTPFIHKLHGREVLSSPTTKIFVDMVPEEITYPQNIIHCATCHTGGADSSRWNTNPSQYACTSCHDAVSFVSPAPAGTTLHTGGACSANDGGCGTSNRACNFCHDPATIQGYHRDLVNDEAAKYQVQFDTITQTAPGQFPVVRFRIVNPQSANAPYDLSAANGPWTQANGASRLALSIGFSNSDFQNVGSGQPYGQPISIDLLAANAPRTGPDANGYYTVTSPTAIPAAATGQGTAAIDGHPAVTFPPATTPSRIPMKNASKAFAITGTSTTARRAVVDINKCNACHFNLSLHGNNRTGDITTCTICHNTEATDGARRPATGAIDGKAQEGIDFKYLIHSIHGTAMGQGIVVYGFGGSVNDFRKVTYPQVPSNCLACHTNTAAFDEPLATANGTTINAGANTTDIADNLRTTKWKATCGACHGTATQQSHIGQMGGTTNATQAQIDAVSK